MYLTPHWVKTAVHAPHLVEAEVLARDSLRVGEGGAVEQQALVHTRGPEPRRHLPLLPHVRGIQRRVNQIVVAQVEIESKT